MHKGFFRKLAFNNIRKNGRNYYPYLISCIGTIMMYYLVHSISQSNGLEKVRGAEYIINILDFGYRVIAVFSAIFLFYTNSFLIKRRKKELGLYNILGLEKRHIGKMMLYETLYIAVTAIVVGLLGGMLFYKLIFMLLLKILKFYIPLAFSIPASSVISTVTLFGIIFSLSLLFNLGQVHVANPIELLKGGNLGEREPKVKWLLVLVSIASLGVGYTIALFIESPLEALNLFFLAVILVMVGTYALFTAGSIALLKGLKRNKKYYYQIKHFSSVSGMMYRMKQNAVGLANICILCTAILIMISTTASFHIGQEDILHTRFPEDVMITSDAATDENIARINELVEAFRVNKGISDQDVLSYRHTFLLTMKGSEGFTERGEAGDLGSCYILNVFPLEDYNQIEGSDLKLEEDEAYIYSPRDPYDEEEIVVNGRAFRVKGECQSTVLVEDAMESMVGGAYYVIVKDMDALRQITQTKPTYYIGFDVNGDRDSIIESVTAFKKQLENQTEGVSLESLELKREEFMKMHGGLFFLGIFLGALFMLATTLIIYYKQVSEGYEDKGRFTIMQKVGMSKQEVKKTIKSQIIMIFSLPLIMAIVHVAFAFKIITRIFLLLSMTNVTLYIICTLVTIAVFSVAYMIVYALTARTYYRIVE